MLNVLMTDCLAWLLTSMPRRLGVHDKVYQQQLSNTAERHSEINNLAAALSA